MAGLARLFLFLVFLESFFEGRQGYSFSLFLSVSSTFVDLERQVEASLAGMEVV